MDFVHPVTAIVPGVQGRILAVLAETTADCNLRTLARLSGVSPAQASRVMATLVRLGIVERREAPPSALFRIVPEHVAARAVRFLSRARDHVLEEMGRLAAHLEPLPVSVIVFGSLVQGDADATSDIDVVVVRPVGIDEDDDRWNAALEEWHRAVERLSGNRVEIIEESAGAIGKLLRGHRSLWREVAEHGLVVFGASLEQMRDMRVG